MWDSESTTSRSNSVPHSLQCSASSVFSRSQYEHFFMNTCLQKVCARKIPSREESGKEHLTVTFCGHDGTENFWKILFRRQLNPFSRLSRLARSIKDFHCDQVHFKRRQTGGFDFSAHHGCKIGER